MKIGKIDIITFADSEMQFIKSETDALNLIKALEKAIKLGWAK